MAVIASSGTNSVEPLISSSISNLSTMTGFANFTTGTVVTHSIINLSTMTGLASKEVNDIVIHPISGMLTSLGSGSYSITGTVVDYTSSPVARKVIAIDRKTNIILDSTFSNSITGEFILHVANTSCIVICIPNISDGVNAEIFDQINPI